MFGFSSPAKPAAKADDPIKDGDIRTFAADVLDASQTTPVFVDFWAPWCGPCKQLTPILEKVVREAKGRVKLVKINVDDNPEIAQQLRVQSIPTVYVFLGGQPVTAFQGVQPESQIRALIERLVGPSGPDEAGGASLDDARAAFQTGDHDRAAALFAAVLEEQPESPEALGGLVKAQVARGRLKEAERTLGQAAPESANHAEIAGARAMVELAKEAGDLPAAAKLESQLAKSPDDHETRVKLATKLFLAGQVQPAFDHLMRIIRHDRAWDDDGARKHLVRLFEALGPTHPDTVTGRRKLSSALFS